MKTYTRFQVQRVIPAALNDALNELQGNSSALTYTNYNNDEDKTVYNKERAFFIKRYGTKIELP